MRWKIASMWSAVLHGLQKKPVYQKTRQPSRDEFKARKRKLAMAKASRRANRA